MCVGFKPVFLNTSFFDFFHFSRTVAIYLYIFGTYSCIVNNLITTVLLKSTRRLNKWIWIYWVNNFIQSTCFFILLSGQWPFSSITFISIIYILCDSKFWWISIILYHRMLKRYENVYNFDWSKTVFPYSSFAFKGTKVNKTEPIKLRRLLYRIHLFGTFWFLFSLV